MFDLKKENKNKTIKKAVLVSLKMSLSMQTKKVYGYLCSSNNATNTEVWYKRIASRKIYSLLSVLEHLCIKSVYLRVECYCSILRFRDVCVWHGLEGSCRQKWLIHPVVRKKEQPGHVYVPILTYQGPDRLEHTTLTHTHTHL